MTLTDLTNCQVNFDKGIKIKMTGRNIQSFLYL